MRIIFICIVFYTIFFNLNLIEAVWPFSSSPQKTDEQRLGQGIASEIAKGLPTAGSNNNYNVIVNMPTNNLVANQRTNVANYLASYNYLIPMAQQKMSEATSFLNKYRNPLILCGICGTYGYTIVRIWQTQNYLKSARSWSNWHPSNRAAPLFEQNQLEVAQELILEIQRRYLSSIAPTNFVRPLIEFSKAIENEKLKIRQLKTFHKIVSTIKLKQIFFLDEELIASLDKRMTQLEFINGSFLFWMANFNLANSSMQHVPEKQLNQIDIIKRSAQKFDFS